MKRLDYVKHKISNVINISRIVTIHYFEFDKNFRFDGEAHDFWELVYVDKGEVIVTVNGTERHLTQGEMIFHKPNEFHKIRANGVTAPNAFIITFVCRSKAMNYFKNKCVRLPEKLRSLIAQIISESRRTYDLPVFDPGLRELTPLTNAIFGGEQLIKLHLEELLIKIRRENTDVLPPETVINHQLTSQIIKILEANIYNKIDMRHICSKTNYGKTYLCGLFKKTVGCGIMQYYVMLKIDEAKKLIRERNYNFTQISGMLMFNSPGYFTAAFRRETGMTPTEYARSVRY